MHNMTINFNQNIHIIINMTCPVGVKFTQTVNKHPAFQPNGDINDLFFFKTCTDLSILIPKSASIRQSLNLKPHYRLCYNIVNKSQELFIL